MLTEGFTVGRRGKLGSIWSSRLFLAAVLAASAATTHSQAIAAPLLKGSLQFDTGLNPYSVAIGDLNGDGKLDLVTANGSFNGVSVLLGNGNGTFATAVSYGTGSDPRSGNFRCNGPVQFLLP